MRLSKATISQTLQRELRVAGLNARTRKSTRRIDNPSGRQFADAPLKEPRQSAEMRNRLRRTDRGSQRKKESMSSCRAGVVVKRMGPCCPRVDRDTGVLSKGSMIESPSQLDGGYQVLCLALGRRWRNGADGADGVAPRSQNPY